MRFWQFAVRVLVVLASLNLAAAPSFPATQNVQHNLQTGLINASVGAVVNTAIHGGDLGDNLTAGWTNAMIMAGLAGVQQSIGDFGTAHNLPEGSLPKILAHAVAGGLASELSGGSFADGALAAGLSEIASGAVGESGLSDQQQINLQRLIATAAVLIANGGDADNAGTAATIAGSAHQNNYLTHRQAGQFEEELLICGDSQDCKLDVARRYMDLSLKNTHKLLSCGSDRKCIREIRREIGDARTAMRQIVTLARTAGFVTDAELFTTLNNVFELQTLDGMHSEIPWHPMVLWEQDYPEFAAKSCGALGASECVLAYGHEKVDTAWGRIIGTTAQRMFESTGVGGLVVGVHECATNSTLAGCAIAATEVAGAAGEALEAGSRLWLRFGDDAVEVVSDGAGGFRRADGSLDITDVTPNTGNARVDAPNRGELGGGTGYRRADTSVEGTTVELSRDVRLQDGRVVPAGSVVVQNEGAIRYTFPDGTVIKGRTANLSPQRTLPPPATNRTLPPKYTDLGDGWVRGPGGKRAWDTGYTKNGQPVYQRESGGYYTIGTNGKQVRTGSPKPHGNTLDNTPTQIYRRVNDLDESYQKTGIANDAHRRYTEEELGFDRIDVIGTRPREQAAKIERFIVERWPGPLNKEPWAGKRNPNHPNYDPDYTPFHMKDN